MYFAIRQQLEDGGQLPLGLESQGETHNGERYTAHKCTFPAFIPGKQKKTMTMIMRTHR